MNTPGRSRFQKMSMGSSETENQIKEIRTEKLTGYLQIAFRDLGFLLFFEEGIPTYGFRVIEDQLFSFSNLATVLDSLEGGLVSFYETSSGLLRALLDIKFGDQIYGTLYTSFCSLRKLFQTLKQEKRTGSVEIDLPSIHCFAILEEGAPCDIVQVTEEEPEPERTELKRERENRDTLEFIFEKADTENGIIKMFERRNPPTILSPDPKEVFVWSDPRRLKLEFAFGQLGKEFEELLDQKMTISQILNVLCVDFVEIAEMYTYLSAKGYIATRKKAN